MDKRYSPKGYQLGGLGGNFSVMTSGTGRYGAQIAFVSGRQPDAGLTPSGNTIVSMPTPYRKCYIERFSIQYEVIPTGTVFTSRLKKVRAGVTTNITNPFTIGVGAIQTTNNQGFAFNNGQGDPERTVEPGDYLLWAINALGGITVQAQGLIGVVELIILE